MPRLIAVRYRLLQGEEAAVCCAESGETHDFGGEVVLTFEGGQVLYVSWVGEPVQYAIGFQDSTHFMVDAELSDFDVSRSSLWSSLVGHDVSLKFVATDNQALEVSSAAERVLFCSFERGHWWADEVTVCRELPAPYDS